MSKKATASKSKSGTKRAPVVKADSRRAKAPAPQSSGPQSSGPKSSGKAMAAKAAAPVKRGNPIKKAPDKRPSAAKAVAKVPGKVVAKSLPAKAATAQKKAAAPPPNKAAAPVAAAPLKAPVVAPEIKKPVHQRHGFKTTEYIVYPAHGVGRILSIEEQEIAGLKLELFVITFEKDKMTLRVPTAKTQSVGMRKLAEAPTVHRAMETLKGRARIKRTMWSRRAQEYEAKINSGDLISIAEVVRDLYRSESQPEQSYSERQLYEAALDRMAREVAAVEKLDDRGAVQKITEALARSARNLRLERAEAEAAAEGEDNQAAA